MSKGTLEQNKETIEDLIIKSVASGALQLYVAIEANHEPTTEIIKRIDQLKIQADALRLNK